MSVHDYGKDRRIVAGIDGSRGRCLIENRNVRACPCRVRPPGSGRPDQASLLPHCAVRSPEGKAVAVSGLRLTIGARTDQ
jgi:hypothetical protein